MITVHHLQNSRSMRIIWLMEELGLDYDIKIYARDATTNLAPADYKALHPLGKAPVVTDDGQTLAETGAIVEYFLDKYPDSGLRPAPGTPERIAYNYWMHFSEGSLMPLLVFQLFLTRMETQPPFFIRPIVSAVTGKLRTAYHTPTLNAQLAFIEAELGRSTWFAGEKMSGADIMMSYPLDAASGRIGLSSYPNINAWLERLRAIPSYQAAIAKGGELDVVK